MKHSRPKLDYRKRSQMDVGMVDLEMLIEAGHPARAVWAVLEGMDFSLYEEQIRSQEGEAGRSARGSPWTRRGSGAAFAGGTFGRPGAAC